MKKAGFLIAYLLISSGSVYCMSDDNIYESLKTVSANPTDNEIERIIEVLKKYSSVTTAISSKDYNAALFLLDYVDESSETDYLLSLFVWPIHFKESKLNSIQLELMNKIIEYKKFNVNSFTSFMGTPKGVYKTNTFHNLLSLALYFDQVDVFNMLLDAGADINAQNGCVLTHAIESGDNEKIRLVLESGSRLDFLDQMYVHQKLEEKFDIETIKLLIDYGAQLDKDRLLLNATCKNKLECVRFLIEVGANPGEDGNILYRAIEHGDYNLVKFFLDYGLKLADGNCVNGNYLACAIRKWDVQTVNLLIERGMDVSRKQEGLANALYFTLSLSPKNSREDAAKDEILKILIKNGALIS